MRNHVFTHDANRELMYTRFHKEDKCSDPVASMGQVRALRLGNVIKKMRNKSVPSVVAN